MNISFEGTVVSNSLPVASNTAAGTSMKRGRNTNSSNPRSKRFRRDGLMSYSTTSIPSSSPPMMMSDDSFSSTASLDDLAESLRECTQRLDGSFLDFSSSANHHHIIGGVGGSAGMNTSNRDLDRSFTFSRLDSSISSNTSPLFGPGGLNTPPTLNTTRSGPPPLMNFTRVRRDSPDRL